MVSVAFSSPFSFRESIGESIINIPGENCPNTSRYSLRVRANTVFKNALYPFP